MMLAIAFFAGGCFWCMESDFEKIKGVEEVTSGFIGGTIANPSYKEVSRGKTKHTEAIKVSYNPEEVSYVELLKHFWINIDPTAKDGQFCDRGRQYRSGIYYQNEQERLLAERSKEILLEIKKFPQIHTEIMEATPFYAAEDYHQDYYKKSSWKYKFYRSRCGRDRTLKKLWGDPAVFPIDLERLSQVLTSQKSPAGGAP